MSRNIGEIKTIKERNEKTAEVYNSIINNKNTVSNTTNVVYNNKEDSSGMEKRKNNTESLNFLIERLIDNTKVLAGICNGINIDQANNESSLINNKKQEGAKSR